ncbi:(2Fe-2S)-binding protein [Shewanella sp. HN-41]|uniref:(2Fe-2S)-binding protein n=1 Tax=Shewanella sp. HN-41 TaxID=327275 RepID=UPI0002125945|nr:(2Fe-2S)-binding protein [Shewanella sp. HN-41]EGM69457.1 ferric reductase [Shewanella sp. HN-41]
MPIEAEQGSANSSIKPSQCIRRTCCLRYQLANTGQCHDCPLMQHSKAKMRASG